MSTPRLFKAFIHSTSRQIYTSVGPEHANPIYIADSERRILKEDLNCPDAPDLIVSVGTGVEEDLIDHLACSSTVDLTGPCACAPAPTAVKKKMSKKSTRRAARPD